MGFILIGENFLLRALAHCVSELVLKVGCKLWFYGRKGKRGFMTKKRQGPMTKKRCYSKSPMNFVWGREDEAKRMTKLDFPFFILFYFIYGNCPSLRVYLKQNSAHALFSAWSFLLVHIRLTHSEGPKKIPRLILSPIQTMEGWTMWSGRFLGIIVN